LGVPLFWGLGKINNSGILGFSEALFRNIFGLAIRKTVNPVALSFELENVAVRGSNFQARTGRKTR
jgi:hypothetical protein